MEEFDGSPVGKSVSERFRRRAAVGNMPSDPTTGQKMFVRACLLYDFKLKKSAAESHRSLKGELGEDDVFKRQCKLESDLSWTAAEVIRQDRPGIMQQNLSLTRPLPTCCMIMRGLMSQKSFSRNPEAWTVLSHPLNITDIAPSDCHIFRLMQFAFAGKKFEDYDVTRI
ncbi:unnamed protein product [Heligmosomoides polygyrus]|uniref:HTH_48 domain-containing protein n=1 Tax=Heligmosomoides polygyrus TaxID=6339 RepID=A0A183FDR4_HELPZ|nr:unnamed protein product [Heligmosomoides polygyrus]